jgi:hypothetical protein
MWLTVKQNRKGLTYGEDHFDQVWLLNLTLMLESLTPLINASVDESYMSGMTTDYSVYGHFTRI